MIEQAQKAADVIKKLIDAVSKEVDGTRPFPLEEFDIISSAAYCCKVCGLPSITFFGFLRTTKYLVSDLPIKAFLLESLKELHTAILNLIDNYDDIKPEVLNAEMAEPIFNKVAGALIFKQIEELDKRDAQNSNADNVG